MKESIFLVAFFKFKSEGPEYGFERINLQYIYKTEMAARKISFCDEAGWYEGALIEERQLAEYGYFFKGKRVWFMQGDDGLLSDIKEPDYYQHTINLIG